jgi:glycine betaine/proline transport system substrate-binding protein
MAIAVGAASCSSSGETGPPPDASTTIRLVQSPWNASRLNVAVAAILLREQLGLHVEVTEIDEFKQWAPIAAGEQHASLEVWPSGHVADMQAYIDTGKVVNAGLLGPTGKISWYVPTYMLTTKPQLATWQAYKDPTLAGLFATPSTGTKGRFLNGDPTWTSYDAQIIANLGLDLELVWAGSEDAELAELDSLYTQQRPILLYLWTPHAALAKYDLTPIELPGYTDACWATAASGGVACDYPTDRLFKIAWPGLEAANPRAYALLTAFSYTTKDQIDLLALVDNQKLTIDQAARTWVDANDTVWGAWLPK